MEEAEEVPPEQEEGIVSDSTAVAATPRPPADAEIEAIKRAGSALALRTKRVGELERRIDGLTWGTGNQMVRGESLSPAAKRQLAEFCEITGAHVSLHIDMLGGKPSLNAQFWTDRINKDPYFHHYEQRDISPSVEKTLRERAERNMKIAADLQQQGHADAAGKRLAMAYDLIDEADDIAQARASWSPRPTATAVVETKIHRFIPAAPMDKIRSGEITDLEPYIIVVAECNWAGGMGDSMAHAKKWDPIGDANPGTTARTRSLRRAGVKSFSAWMQPYEEQIRKAEEILEAEFEIVLEDRAQARAALPAPGGPQAVHASGEPSAANATGAKPLPVEGEIVQDEPAAGGNQGNPGGSPEAAPSPAAPFDKEDARKKLFAMLRDVGIKDAGRKKWAKENGLPESTQQWGQAEFEKAIGILEPQVKALIAEIREKVLELAGDGFEQLCYDALEQAAPKYLAEWRKVLELAESRQVEEEDL